MLHSLLHDGLAYWRGRTPDKLAVAVDEAELTYEQLGRWSDGIAHRLQAAGVEQGDNVAITGSNCIEWIAAAFGVLKAGAAIVPYNERFVRDEMEYLVGFSSPSAIIADAPRAEILASLNTGVPILPMEALDACRSGAPHGWEAVRVSSDSIAMIIFTSGTTGRPKGVMVAHGKHLAKFYEQMLMERSVNQDARIFMPLSIHAAPGTQWGYILSTTLGATCHFTKKFEAAKALEILVNRRITMLMGMPLIYEQISRLPGFAEADLSSIQFAQVGGARVFEPMVKAWRDKGVIIRQLYGMTEVGGAGIFASPEEALAHPNSCGRGLAFTKVRVVRDDGTPCEPNEPGNVLLGGPGMMAGYWRNPEETAKLMIDGWAHTGDIGVLNDDGYFFFVDRAKDMVISGGYNISPTEIEAVISQYPGIIEVAVVSVPDEKFGETPCACIHSASPVEPRALFNYCKERLAGFKLPRYVVHHVEPLPRMTSGKLNKRQMRADHVDVPKHHEWLS